MIKFPVVLQDDRNICVLFGFPKETVRRLAVIRKARVVLGDVFLLRGYQCVNVSYANVFSTSGEQSDLS